MAQLSQQLYQLLSTIANPALATTANLAQVTAELSKIYKTQPVIVPLVELALSANEEPVRHLAAVEARKRIAHRKAWAKVDANQRAQIKAHLLTYLEQGQAPSEKLVHALAQVVVVIAQLELEQGQWPEVMPWLWGVCHMPSVSHREMGGFVLLSLLDTLSSRSSEEDPLSKYTHQLFQLIGKLLNDTESLKTRVLAVRALGNAVVFLDLDTQLDPADAAIVQAFVPAILAIGTQCIEAKDETSTGHVYEQIEILTLIDQPIIQNHIIDVIGHCLQIGAMETIDQDLRMPALNAVLFIIKYKKARVQALDLAKHILERLFPIITQDAVDDDDDGCPSRTAGRLVELLAMNLPPAQVVPPLIELCRQYAGSPDPKFRKAAVEAFGKVFDGCSLFLQPHLDSLWPLVDASLIDTDLIVRKAACSTLVLMCNELGDDCAKRHAVLLPRVLELVTQPETQRNALACLDALLECLTGELISPYLTPIMERLLTLLPTANPETQIHIVGAIGSAAHASKRGFIPYFEAVMTQFLPFLALGDGTESDETRVRGTTQDTVATLAVAVGRDVFNPYFEQCMRSALVGATLDSPSLHECCYVFFSVIARVYKEEMAPFLPQIIPLLVAAIAQSEEGDDDAETLGDHEPNGEIALTSQDTDDFEDVDIDDDDDEVATGTAIAMEKETATEALGLLFEHVGLSFVPYVEITLKAFHVALAHYYDTIRKNAVQALTSYIETAFKLSGDAKGQPSLHPPPLNAQVQGLIDTVLPMIMSRFETDTDRDVVLACCEELANLTKVIGPAIVVKHLDVICQTTHKILERTAPCQLEDDGEDDEVNNEDLAEWDAALIRSASDLVGALAVAIGADFASAFQTFLPSIARYYDMKREVAERSGAIGSLAEAVVGLGAAATPFTDTLVALFFQALHDPDLDVNSNAAYAIGALVFASEIDLSSRYVDILTALRPCLEADLNPDDGKQACDNACGAIARLILKNAAGLPLDQVLPVYLARLPVRYDYVENVKVMDSLLLLLGGTIPAAQPYATQILSIIQHVLEAQRVVEADPDTTDEAPLTLETKGRVIEGLKHLSTDRVAAAGLMPYLT